MKLYKDLTTWYWLVDPPADHADEAAIYSDALVRGITGAAETMLELGAGAGNNAAYMKHRFRCTLTDLSDEMQALSRQQNPDCEHVAGDMRTLRLGRTFDAVFVHDAVAYMTTLDDLRAVARTAFVHTRPGGAAVFAPDYVRETFRDSTQLISGDDGARALRGIEWAWDLDPTDSTYQVEYSFLLREGGRVEAVHDRHAEGLFRTAEWIAALGSAGYEVEVVAGPVEGDLAVQAFLCRRVG